jgi:hypothetical protein
MLTTSRGFAVLSCICDWLTLYKLLTDLLFVYFLYYSLSV